MKNYRDITAQEVNAMSYNELIGLVRETNRPPGGRRSIFDVAARCWLTSESHVLDIGTSTGSTAIEFARLVNCKAVGIDINMLSLCEATERARLHGLDPERVRFQEADATNLPFPDGHFDLVFCGNVTSLVDDKSKALSEYRRVVKYGGYIAAIPMYYVDTPSDALVNDVRRAIQVEIPVHYRDQAVRFYAGGDLELFDAIDFRFNDVPEAEIAEFSQEILARSHLRELPAPTKQALDDQYSKYMLLFRENLRHMGYTILLLRKTRFREDRELFMGERMAALAGAPSRRS